MFNEMIAVSITPFSGTITPDKNGNMAVMLQLIAGKMPNRNVLSGTVAERLGIEIGKSYLMQVRERGIDDTFGSDYTFIKVKELETGEDLIKSIKLLGLPNIVTIPRPEGYKAEYQRKSVAVEGLVTKRIKEGHYHPIINTTVTEHENAKEVLKGTSNDALNQSN